MPELPEVETIVRALRQGGRGGAALTGRSIQSVTLTWERTLATPGVADFATRITGQTIHDVQRRAKFIVMPLTLDTLIIHLRMSGDLRVETGFDLAGKPLPLLPHDRLAIYFSDGLRLAFNDARKFGRVWLTPHPEDVLTHLGPEPLDENFTVDTLAVLLRARKRQIKPLLLDQSVLAGLGNIYTDEALHVAKVHPTRLSNTLTTEETAQLWNAIRIVLQAGIHNNGASIDWAYRGGDFQNNFRVYQRTGQPCPVCGYPVERIVIGQRGTHFCPNCQV